MQYIVSLLPLLACPVMMGLVMWVMMRPTREQPPQERHQTSLNTGEKLVDKASTSAPRSLSFNLLGMCLDWRVLAGLTVVGLGIWVVAPSRCW
jgi:hypothetical protein